jgi:3-methyladenine DNA glycosylase AlkD
MMMAGQVGRDKGAPDSRFLALLPLIEKGARDERAFVQKAVSWALRRIGRRNRSLNAACLGLARRLAESDAAPARWVGRDAARELAGATVRALLASQAR